MIETKVEVEEYCNTCPNFTTETNEDALWADDGKVGTLITIRCKYRRHCAHLIKHLDRAADQEG